jgi:hypothetical protein
MDYSKEFYLYSILYNSHMRSFKKRRIRKNKKILIVDVDSAVVDQTRLRPFDNQIHRGN